MHVLIDPNSSNSAITKKEVEQGWAKLGNVLAVSKRLQNALVNVATLFNEFADGINELSKAKSFDLGAKAAGREGTKLLFKSVFSLRG